MNDFSNMQAADDDCLRCQQGNPANRSLPTFRAFVGPLSTPHPVQPLVGTRRQSLLRGPDNFRQCVAP